MIEIKNVKKYYGKFPALDDITFCINEGSFFGFAGPNGAGKTTTIKIITGLLSPDGGSVLIDGESPGKKPGIIGYVPDTFSPYHGLKVYEYLMFFANLGGLSGLEASSRIKELLDRMGLLGKADTDVDFLSLGMKQKLSVARALLPDPKYLIMDEPASGLDPGTRYEFKALLSELSDLGKTVIISSHILSDITELCTDVCIIDSGRIVLCEKLWDMMGRLTKGSRIVIGLNSAVSEAAEFLRNEKCVRSLSVKGSEIKIVFDGTIEDEAGLLAKMTKNNIPVRAFFREKESLETVFMQLTGKNREITLFSYEVPD